MPESDQSAPVTPLPDLLLLLVLLVGNYVHNDGPKRDCDVTRGPFRIGVTRWRRKILMCGFRKLRIMCVRLVCCVVGLMHLVGNCLPSDQRGQKPRIVAWRVPCDRRPV